MMEEAAAATAVAGLVSAGTSVVADEASVDGVADESFFSSKFKGHRGSVISLDTHPVDASLFASGSEDCTARLWDLRSKNAVKCFVAKSHPVPAVAFDLKLPHILYAVVNNEINSFDVRKDGVLDRTPLSTISFELSADVDVNSLSVHPKERQLAVADDEKITIIDLTSQKQRVFTRLHSNVVSKVIFRPNSSGGIASCGFDYLYNSWDYRTGRSKFSVNMSRYSETVNNTLGSQQLTNPPFIHDFAFVNNGKNSVLALGDGSICVLDSLNGDIICRERGHEGMATNVESSSDDSSNRCISGGVDRCINIWEVHSDKIAKIGGFCHGKKINAIRCCRTGDVLSNACIISDVSHDISVVSLKA